MIHSLPSSQTHLVFKAYHNSLMPLYMEGVCLEREEFLRFLSLIELKHLGSWSWSQHIRLLI